MAKPLMCDTGLLKQDLSDRTYVVTGANSGIGLETAKQLAEQGAEVVLACRNLPETEQRIGELQTELPKSKLVAMKLDLADLESVRQFAKEFGQKYSTLNGLVNNAGVMNTPKQSTKDGFEMQIGVNHLGHVLLTELLLEPLKRAAPSRIISVSSCYHDKAMGREGRIDFDDLSFDSRKYDGWAAYSQSKLANVLHMKALAEELKGSGVSCASVHPGWVRTNLAKHTMPLWVQNTIMRPVLSMLGMISPWEGAQTTLHALLSPEVSERSGEYYSQRGLYRDKAFNVGGWPLQSPNPNANDPAKAEQLLKFSRELVGAA